MRLIDVNHLLQLVKKNAPFIYSILAPIAKLCPIVEAEPVRHGRWVDAGLGFMMLFSCSACKRQAILSGVDSYDYCPNCGAKMDAKEDA